MPLIPHPDRSHHPTKASPSMCSSDSCLGRVCGRWLCTPLHSTVYRFPSWQERLNRMTQKLTRSTQKKRFIKGVSYRTDSHEPSSWTKKNCLQMSPRSCEKTSSRKLGQITAKIAHLRPEERARKSRPENCAESSQNAKIVSQGNLCRPRAT